MQSNHLDIYKMVASDTGVSEELYKDIGSFIFKETARLLKEPTSLILKLKGIGSWHLRKKRMEIVINEYTDRSEVKTRDQFDSDSSFKEYQEKHNRYVLFQERLKDYEKYLAIKSEIRKKRYETQVLLTPEDDGDEKFKSS